jgi:predicted dehydrogenase
MAQSRKRRVALIGTGHRGAGTWGRELLATCGDWVEMVGLSDSNPLRLERARAAIGVEAPVFSSLGAMIAETGPDTLIVTTRDDTHAGYIIEALEAGVDVLAEKPMAITAATCRDILAAERRTGHRVDVAFNYRFSPLARKIKELLLSGVIGAVESVDFHWYLDVHHGADYFRRWHAFRRFSGSLFVHKATHHFDLLNWYLASDPEEVFARGSLRHYGSAGPYRSVRCRTCSYAATCAHYFDMSKDPWLELIYEGPSREDGYVRDACVYREEIDIFDTMTAAILYANGVQVSYSLNAFMPIEGFHLAFNGQRGRLEIRQFEKQAWPTPDYDEILLALSFGKAERIRVERAPGGHFGGDPALQRMLFDPEALDSLNQRAGARAGAMSVLLGLAAVESADGRRTVAVAPLLSA